MGTQRQAPRLRYATVLVGALLVGVLGFVGVRAAVSEDSGGSDERAIELDGATPIRISPDGEFLAAAREGRLCVYEVASLAERACAARELISIHHGGVAWSPDGRRLAFTEDGARRVDESDLWVMEAASGELTNLTDDGLDAVEPGSAAPRDLWPAWAPDGTAIAFARGGAATGLYRVPAGGGEAVEILAIPEAGGASVRTVGSLHWLATPDGVRLLYRLDGGLGKPETGLWAVSPDGGEPELLLQVDSQRTGSSDPPLPAFVQVAHVAPRGEALVFASGEAPGFALLRLSVGTGAVETVREAPAAGAASGIEGNPNPLMAALSPDGTRLLYVTVGGRLILREAGGEETVLAEDLDVVPGSSLLDLGPALAWLEDGTVFVPLAGEQALLLTLAE